MGETITMERMGYGPETVGHLASGKAVFVAGVAPGEEVEVELTQEKASFARGRAVRVVQSSPARVPGGEAQVGAPWAHLTYEAQLEAKRSNVAAALQRTAGLAAEDAERLVAPCLPSRREWGYRNKLELNVGQDPAGRLTLGLMREGSSDLAPLSAYPLAHKVISKAPKALQGALRYAQGTQDLGLFRVGVRHSLATGDLEVALWTRPGAFPRAAVAKTLSSALPATSIVRVLAEPGRARAVKGVETLAGRGRWGDVLRDAAYEVTAPSFFQVNSAQAEKLIDCVLEALGGPRALAGARVADLYAGVGTFSVQLALAGADVVAVESSGPAVRDLRRNADDNAVDVEVLGGDAARELPGLGRIDALVVDPPRAGLAEGVAQSVAAAKPERVVYVSCDPPTWARDVARLVRLGYELESVQPVDLFPQTYHVETVALMSR